MKQYEVKGRVFTVGVDTKMQLNKDQASAREHALEKIGDDVYVTKQKVEFMKGEVIGLDGDPGLLEALNIELLGSEETAGVPVGADLTDEELIARAKGLGIKRPGLKKKEKLLRLIAEAEEAKAKSNPILTDITDPDEDDSLDNLDISELVELAHGLNIENAGSMEKVELIDAITKATGDAE